MSFSTSTCVMTMAYTQKCIECHAIRLSIAHCYACVNGWLCEDCVAAHTAWHTLRGDKAATECITKWPKM